MTMPEPLTPADCDLQDYPFMPLHVSRLRDSDFAATEDPEACWYAVMLWCASWHQVPAASLPDDDAVLTKLAGLGRDVKTFRRHRKGALRGFVLCSDGRLYHPVVAEQARIGWQAKIEQRYRTECARRKKAAQRTGGEYVAPSFDDRFAEQGLAPLVPAMSPGTGKGHMRDKDSDVPGKNGPRDRDRDRDRDRKILRESIPTQPLEPEAARADLPDGFDQVVAAAGLRITAKNRDREAAVLVGWVGMGLGLEEIIKEIRRVLAEKDGPTSTLGRFDRGLRDLAARRALPKAEPVPSGPSGRDDCEDGPAIRQAMRAELGEKTYASWLRPCDLRREGETLIVSAPSTFSADWIRNHLADRVRVAARAKLVEVRAA